MDGMGKFGLRIEKILTYFLCFDPPDFFSLLFVFLQSFSTQFIICHQLYMSQLFKEYSTLLYSWIVLLLSGAFDRKSLQKSMQIRENQALRLPTKNKLVKFGNTFFLCTFFICSIPVSNTNTSSHLVAALHLF